MRKVRLTLKLDEQELSKAIEFIHGQSDHTETIKDDFFPKNKVAEINLVNIVDDRQRHYLYNSLVASLITVQGLCENNVETENSNLPNNQNTN